MELENRQCLHRIVKDARHTTSSVTSTPVVFTRTHPSNTKIPDVGHYPRIKFWLHSMGCLTIIYNVEKPTNPNLAQEVI